ncbi:CBS domain-containing protein [Chloroflexota bacterium]
MYLRDVMTTDVLTLPSKTPIIKAKRIMEANKLRRIPVVDDDKLVGIVTRKSLEKLLPSEPNPRDLFEFSYNIASLYRKPIANVMRTDVVTASPDMTAEEAVALAQSKKVGALVVVDKTKVVGIATTNNFFYSIINEVLGVGLPGARIEVEKGGEGKSLEEIIICMHQAGLNICTLHLYKHPGSLKRNVVAHVDSDDAQGCITELEKRGYKVNLRKR